MSPAEKHFSRLVRIAVGCESELAENPSEDVWEEIYTLVRKQALTGVLYAGIERLPRAQRPPLPILLDWYALAEKIKMQNARLNRQATVLCLRFTQARFPSTVLKGQGVAQFYPRPELRQAGDIDIWVAGGHRRIVPFLRKRCPVGEVVYHHVDTRMFKNTEVEVHFRPSWFWNPVHNRRLQRWFAAQAPAQMSHAVALPGEVEGFVAPTRSFNAVFLLLHIYRHLFDEGIGLRQLMDYYYVLCQPEGAEPLDREAVCRLLRRFGLSRFAAAVMYVLREVFGLEENCFLLPPDSRRGRMLLDEIMLAGNFGQYDVRLVRARRGTVANLVRKMRRNARFLRYYPQEILWEFPFKIWHYCWRKAVNRRP